MKHITIHFNLLLIFLIVLSTSCQNTKQSSDIRALLIGQTIGSVQYNSLEEFADMYIEKEYREGDLSEYTISIIFKDDNSSRLSYQRIKLTLNAEKIQSSKELEYFLDFPFESFHDVQNKDVWGKAFVGRVKNVNGVGNKLRIVVVKQLRDSNDVNGYMVLGDEVAKMTGKITSNEGGSIQYQFDAFFDKAHAVGLSLSQFAELDMQYLNGTYYGDLGGFNGNISMTEIHSSSDFYDLFYNPESSIFSEVK